MKKQRGFSIIMAIFILVVLSLLGGYMVNLSGVQHATVTYSLQGLKAYQGARAGIEWSIARISAGGSCANITAASPLSFTGINGFSVTLSCVSQIYSEGLDNPVVYQITALSEFGSYNSAHYVSRNIEVTILN